MVIIGAGLVGCETGIVLANKGKEVIIIEMEDKLLPEPVFIQNLMMLSQLIDQADMESHVLSRLMEIKDGSVIINQSGKDQEISCDSVVLAMGYTANQEIYESLKDQIDIVNIGDSIEARKVLDAVREAHDAVFPQQARS